MVKNISSKYYEAVGRRREAVARVRLYVVGRDKTANVGGTSIKQGEIFLNKKHIDQTLKSEVEKQVYLAPLELTNTKDKFAISIIVKGGGKVGQLEAIAHGLSRAIEKVDHDEYRPSLKKAKLLRRDPRTRERRKVGTGGKARRQKQSPKR